MKHMSKKDGGNFFSLSHKMHELLGTLGIPSTLILDSSVGYMMGKVDYVLMGAEGVVESGGIVNKVS